MKTILVVDDEFGIAEALSSTLTDEGYRVFTAANGKQGLAVLAEVKPDLVIIDFMMPIMDGRQMLETLQADPAFANLPVIMMSAVAESELRRQIDGFAAYLRKPFGLDKLLVELTRILGP